MVGVSADHWAASLLLINVEIKHLLTSANISITCVWFTLSANITHVLLTWLHLRNRLFQLYDLPRHQKQSKSEFQAGKLERPEALSLRSKMAASFISTEH